MLTVTESGPFESGDALFAFDRELRLVAWNEAAVRTTGFAPRQVLGRPCWEVLDGLDDNGDPVCRPDCVYARMMMEGESPDGPTVWIRTANGRRRVSFSLVSIRAGGHPSYLHLVHPAPGPEDALPVARPELTARQREVLELTSAGLSGREVARQLGLAETTVRNHLVTIRFKLNCETGDEAIAKARELGLIEAVPGA